MLAVTFEYICSMTCTRPLLRGEGPGKICTRPLLRGEGPGNICTRPLLRGEEPGNEAVMYHGVIHLHLLASMSVKTTK